MRAIARLNRDTRANQVDFVSFSGRGRGAGRELPEIITPTFDENRVDDTDDAAPLCFSVSHYIGTYSTQIDGDQLTLEIKPRWGADWLEYLLGYTTGIYLPPDAATVIAPQRDSAEWLLVLLWRSLFQQALRHFHLPREYRAQPINERFFRGRLDVPRHIRLNLADGSRFACVYRPLTPDIIINRTIRFVLKKLEGTPYGRLVGDLHAHGERLAGFGVRQPESVMPEELDRIRYSKLNEGYRPLMHASRAIIRRFGSGTHGSAEKGPSFFIDIAELWENYLQGVLSARLPPEFRVYSPNDTGGEWLVDGERRRIRPDLIIEKDSGPVAVLDAKFKRYTWIGKYAAHGVSREDLHQMTTYLYHYGRFDKPITGLFVCPGGGEGDIGSFVSHPLHSIGVVNFGMKSGEPLVAGEDIDLPPFDLPIVRVAEDRFAEVVLRHLRAASAMNI